MRVGSIELVERAFETITPGATTAVGFTASLIPPTDTQVERVIITVSAGAIRYRIDGTDPDTTTGHELADLGSDVIIGQAAMTNFRCIEDSGASGSYISCSFLGTGKT